MLLLLLSVVVVAWFVVRGGSFELVAILFGVVVVVVGWCNYLLLYRKFGCVGVFGVIRLTVVWWLRVSCSLEWVVVGSIAGGV